MAQSLPSKDISFLRTPDTRFAGLPDFPYLPKYLQYGNLRMAYVDESNKQSDTTSPDTFLCLHGQPTWSFLYRKMIPLFLASTKSRRIIAPDLFGFGRSDKPTRDEVYTFNFHRHSLINLITTLDLRDITLVVQDWGGLLGLTIPSESSLTGRFKRMIVMNTSIGTGQKPTQGFIDWRTYSNKNPDMAIGPLLARSCRLGGLKLSSEEIRAYDAPFPDVRYKGGVRRFPNLVMTDPAMEGVDVSASATEFYRKSNHFGRDDIIMVCGMKDPVLGPPVMRNLSKVWKNGCWWGEIENGGHFVQEWGQEVVEKSLAVFDRERAGEVEGMKQVEKNSTKASL